MKLTDDFDTTIDTKIFGGVTPTPLHIDNAKILAENAQEIRDFINSPIKVTSGLRNHNPKGGSKTSQHFHGEAWDLSFKGLDLVFTALVNGTLVLPHKCSQVIKERNSDGNEWLHMAITTDRWIELQPERSKFTEFLRTTDTINYTMVAVK